MVKYTPSTLSKEIIKEILTSNLTYFEIADKYDISKDSARQIFRSNPEYTYVNKDAGGRIWNKEDEQFILDNYKEKGDFEVGKILNRTVGSILRKRVQLGLRRKEFHIVENKPARYWSDKETAFLVDNNLKLTFDAIATKLNRPLKGIMLKALRLGLLSSNRWSKKEDELLKKYYNSSLDQLAFLLDRSKKAIKHRASHLNITLGSVIKTSIEITIENILLDAGIIYEYNIKLGKDFQFKADFVFGKTVIEVHGDYWHANPLTYTILNTMQQYAVEKDAVKKEYFESLGYTVHVIWECEILGDIDKIKKFINNLIEENV